MNIQSVKRIIRDYTALPSVLALSIVLSACDTGQDLGKYKTELQAADDSFTVTEDKMFSGNVALNDSVGAGRSYSLGTGASNGVVDLSDDGSFTYMPNADFFGSDSFTVNVSWGNGASATTTTSLTVEDTPDNLPEFGWEMVWSDEFDGAELDAANWTPQIGDGRFEEYPFGPLDRWGNGEEQWYLAENATVEDGNLVITARQEEVEPDFAYTSARLRTIDKVDIKYGRIEARVKAPSGKGLWSAFWMLPTDSPYTNWAAFGEVDIMEVVNASTADELVAGNSYYGFPWPNFQTAGEQAVLSSSPDGDFHVYAIEWEADEIRWYVDDVHYLTVTSDTYYTYYYAGQETGYALGPDGAPFDVDFHILLNLAVGGGFPGDVAPETVFPAQMLVDYVRVYECSADPVTGSGCASFVDESVEPKPADAPFIQSYDLYTDGAGSLTWLVGESVVSRDLEIGVFDNGGVFSLTEVAAEDEARGTVLDVVTSNAGNFSLFAKNVVKVDDVPINYFERVALINMGDSSASFRLQAAELKFDLYIDSAGTDTASALQIKMDSEYPNLGFVQLEMADLPLDQWTTVSVKLNDLVDSFGPMGDPLDTSAVLNLFVLEPTGMAHLQVDNIQLVCGHPSTCGIKTPVSDDIPVTPPPSVDPVPGQIYIDAVDPAWAVFDCCDGTTEQEVDTGDPEYGNAMQYTYFGTTVAGFDARAVAGENLSNFAGGTLEFDVYLVNAPDAGADTPWRLKLEAADPNVNLEVGLADSVEGVEPTVGAWQHYTFNKETAPSSGWITSGSLPRRDRYSWIRWIRPGCCSTAATAHWRVSSTPGIPSAGTLPSSSLSVRRFPASMRKTRPVKTLPSLRAVHWSLTHTWSPRPMPARVRPGGSNSKPPIRT
jgi:beta-glucanase (GH16 family)